MDKDFYRKKIESLDNKELLSLIKTANNPSNTIIFQLAKVEAERRHLEIDPLTPITEIREEKEGNLSLLKKWNWAAVIFGPIWALANNLSAVWTFLCFVPFLNIMVAIYLGFNGNKLAFEKSRLKSVTDFMAIQQNWNLWAIRMFWIGLFIGIVLLLAIGV